MSFLSSYLFVLSLFLSFIDDTNHHRINNCTSEDVKHPLYFLGFFPCFPDSNRDLNECDMLTLSAVEIAMDRINQDPNILSCFKLELLSVHVNNPVKDPTEAFHIIHNQYTNLPFHGVIGPDHSNIAKLFGYIFGIHTYILQISYSVTDPSLEDTSRYPYFYATVPTDYRLNKAKQDILMHFNWKKVAVLSADTDYHILISQQLTSILGGNPVQYIGSYTTSPNALLIDAKQHDFRIFIAVIDMKGGRNLLCSAYHNGIATADHVWILPGIYNTKWWYIEGNDTTSNCTNEQILEAINSTLFVDTLSFDITTTNLEMINDVLTKTFTKSQVVSGSQQSFEFHHLLHSKLLHAYDATMALALTWNNTLFKLSNNYTSEQIFALIDCPWNRPSLIHKELIDNLKDSLENVVSPYQGLAGLHIFDHERSRDNSSNALITQLTGEYECVLRGFEGPYNSCNLSVCCNDSWKGGYVPTDGYCPNGTCVCRFISPYALTSIIVCSVLLIIGIIISVVFFFVNLLLRKNKHFKASSPVHNCIMTVSCIFMLIAGVTELVAFVIGITGSGKEALPYLCNVSVGLFWLSLATINATALVKNWRIFRIFYNPEYKERKYLSNLVLNIAIVVIVLPIVVGIIAFYCLNPIPKIDTNIFQSKCPNINTTQKTYVEEDTCLTYVDGWNKAFGGYLVILFVILFVVGTYNCKTFSSYKKEGEVAALTSAVSVLVLTLVNITVSTLAVYSQLPRIETLIVLHCDSLSIYCIFILTFTYLPKLVAILRDKTRTRDNRVSLYRRIRKFVQLHDDVANLKYTLDMIDNSITTLSTEKQLFKTKDLEQ